MGESAYSLFKSPTLIDKGEAFLEATLRRFQGRVEYTPNLAQEINPSRNQRQINVDRVSIRKGGPRRIESPGRVRGVLWPWLPFTHADSYSRCFRIELGTTNSPCPCVYRCRADIGCEQIVRLVRLSSSKPMQSRAGTNQGKRPSVARYLNLIQLDRITQTKQGGCLYEQPTHNQTQALTTPVNLVGGALTCEPYLPLVGPKPPYKGGSYAYK